MADTKIEDTASKQVASAPALVVRTKPDASPAAVQYFELARALDVAQQRGNPEDLEVAEANLSLHYQRCSPEVKQEIKTCFEIASEGARVAEKRSYVRSKIAALFSGLRNIGNAGVDGLRTLDGWVQDSSDHMISISLKVSETIAGMLASVGVGTVRGVGKVLTSQA
ncbi:MAG: hypothetical protein PHZ00_04280 [Candidatus Peribacteraceae bacterium]|nr:hypothetical protein [Candidatus Peribacteraceae bacterium]